MYQFSIYEVNREIRKERWHRYRSASGLFTVLCRLSGVNLTGVQGAKIYKGKGSSISGDDGKDLATRTESVGGLALRDGLLFSCYGEAQFRNFSQGFHECQVKVQTVEVGLKGFERLPLCPVLGKVRQRAQPLLLIVQIETCDRLHQVPHPESENEPLTGRTGLLLRTHSFQHAILHRSRISRT